MHGKVNITYINLFAYARKNKNNIYKITLLILLDTTSSEKDIIIIINRICIIKIIRHAFLLYNIKKLFIINTTQAIIIARRHNNV